MAVVVPVVAVALLSAAVAVWLRKRNASHALDAIMRPAGLFQDHAGAGLGGKGGKKGGRGGRGGGGREGPLAQDLDLESLSVGSASGGGADRASRHTTPSPHVAVDVDDARVLHLRV